jgi:uncharacterized protein with HEPN domain
VKDRLLPLRHILDAIERLEEYAAAGKQAFLSEPMRKDAIARNLEVIGEAVTRLPDDLRAKTPDFHGAIRSTCAPGSSTAMTSSTWTSYGTP